MKTAEYLLYACPNKRAALKSVSTLVRSLNLLGTANNFYCGRRSEWATVENIPDLLERVRRLRGDLSANPGRWRSVYVSGTSQSFLNAARRVSELLERQRW